MKSAKLVLAALLLTGLANSVWGQEDTLFYDFFSEGVPHLEWINAWNPDSAAIMTQFVTGNPSGDGWVGVVDNSTSGGGVGTVLAGNINMTDYEIRAQVYCTVSPSSGGAYHAVVARCDTVGGLQFYYLRSDFDTDQRLQLRYYDGSMTGVTIATWTGGQIPGGVPTTDSWHHMAIKCAGNQIWAYWDDILLSGSPFTDASLSRGFFGVYIFRFTGLAQTLCDDIVVLGEAGAQPFDLIAQTNHFLDQGMQEMTIRPAAGQTIYFKLNWDAINGTGTSPSFRNTLRLDNSVIFSENNPGVQPNTNHTTQSNSWVATLGQHVLRWTLDSLNQVNESNENNNALVDTFLVLNPNAYDFQADSTWIADEDTIPFADTVMVGETVRFVLHWSAPMGVGPSGPFNVTFNLDGESYFLTTFPGLSGAGGPFMMVASPPWTATLGFHYFEWFLDADNWVEEFAEWNNSTLDGFEVIPFTAVKWGAANAPQPKNLRIASVYPNPFNPQVTLRFETAQAGAVKLTVFDVEGRQVAVLADGFYPQGAWEATWDGGKVATGTYFAVLEGSGKRSVQPLFLVK